METNFSIGFNGLISFGFAGGSSSSWGGDGGGVGGGVSTLISLSALDDTENMLNLL